MQKYKLIPIVLLCFCKNQEPARAGSELAQKLIRIGLISRLWGKWIWICPKIAHTYMKEKYMEKYKLNPRLIKQSLFFESHREKNFFLRSMAWRPVHFLSRTARKIFFLKSMAWRSVHFLSRTARNFFFLGPWPEDLFIFWVAPREKFFFDIHGLNICSFFESHREKIFFFIFMAWKSSYPQAIFKLSSSYLQAIFKST